MNSKLLRLSVGLVALPVTLASFVSTASAAAGAEAGKRHPLKGVVVALDAEQSALRVKHEDIPGVMRAMTMQFKVDAATLKIVKSGDTITAQLSRDGGEWRLYEVKVVAPAKK